MSAIRIRTAVLSSLFASAISVAACSDTPTGTPDPDAGAGNDAATVDGGGVACGVRSGSTCSIGTGCAADADCTSTVCGSDKKCVVSTCTDGRKGGSEEGVDCGGTDCKKCDGATCQAPTDCTSAICFQNVCAPSGTKTCGVGLPNKCADGILCQTDHDCTNDVCDSAKCRAVTPADHTDGRQNAGETGVDCGGTVAACVGDACALDADCKSLLCYQLKCVKEGTKVCGVGFPSLCADTKPCDTDTDCANDFCDAKKCSPVTNAAHVDGRRDAGETGVDCGGSIKANKVCPKGQGCGDDGDCESRCDVNHLCTAPSHTDGKTSPSLGETDVDCGGAMADGNGVAAIKCRSAKSCLTGPDCDSGFCTNKVCEPRKIGRKDGDETDVDCGGTADPDTGTAAARCQDSKICGGAGDCKSAQCYNSICVGGRSCATASTSGITTCGLKESNDPNNVQESCCKALPMPNLPALRMAKYEVTAGRMRQFITSVGANLRTWATQEIGNNTATGQRLSPMLPSGLVNFLPASANAGEPLNLLVQLGAGVIDKRVPSQSQGCFNGSDSYGHATYWQPAADLRALYGNSFPARRFSQAQYDEKSMNCSPYWMYAAFCAWDGGRLPTRAEYLSLWGPGAFPWGASRYPTSGVVDYTKTVNWGNAIPATPVLFYHYPDYAGSGNLADSAGYIAAPGRFPLDLTALRSASGEGWMDVGANLMEMAKTEGGNSNFCDFANQAQGEATSPSCAYTEQGQPTQYGVLRAANGMPTSTWEGGSWEGHHSFDINSAQPFIREAYTFSAGTQYGKAGFRCVYPN